MALSFDASGFQEMLLIFGSVYAYFKLRLGATLVVEEKSPEKFARAIVQATLHFDNPKMIADATRGLGEPMRGLDIRTMDDKNRMQTRGI